MLGVSHVDSFRRWASRLCHYVMQKGRIQLASMSRQGQRANEGWFFDDDGGVCLRPNKNQPDSIPTPSITSTTLTTADAAMSVFSLAYCHMLLVAPRIQHPKLVACSRSLYGIHT